jgi:peptidyl-prolyl cis-trans isomerase B (cyclophilin B)
VTRLLALLLACVLLTACGSDEDSGGETPAAESTPTPTATATAEAEEGGCRQVDAPAPKGEQSLKEPSLELRAGRTYVATVQTSCGTFEITLDAKRAPKTGGAFVTLARRGFFDGLTFHRIVPDFVIQGGDPKGDGTGGPGFSVEEAPPSDLEYAPGVVAMAKAQNEPAGTSGSQFFVVSGEQGRQLTPDYALLGKVTKGMDVVETIGAIPADAATGAPSQPVVIEKISIEQS